MFPTAVHLMNHSRSTLAVARRVKALLQSFPGGRLLVDAARLYRLRRRLALPQAIVSRYELDQLVLLSLRRRVAAGPFVGMRYIDESHGSVLAAKLLGSYESELHPWIEQITRTRYQAILDIGCAEGYYAVGLALRMPRIPVYAFDCDLAAQEALRCLAARNRVESRIAIGGHCVADDLLARDGHHSLVLCDIEGDELDLLDRADVAAALRHSDLLVEVHDEPGSTSIQDRLKQRYAPTHLARLRRHTAARVWNDAAGVALPRRQLQRLAMDEGRTRGLQWMYFHARSSRSHCQEPA